MFIEVDVLYPHPQKGVGETMPPRDRAPRLNKMQEDGEEGGERDPPAELTACLVCFYWPDYAVAIAVEEAAVLF